MGAGASELSEEDTREQLDRELHIHEALYRETRSIWEDPSKNIKRHLGRVKDSFWVYDKPKYHFYVRQEYKVKAGERLVESGSVPILCDVVADNLHGRHKQSYYKEALFALVNFARRNEMMCGAIDGHGKLLPAVVRKLDDLCQCDKDGKPEVTDKDLAWLCLNLLNNVARVEGCEQLVRQIPRAFQVVSKFLASTGIVKILAVSTLAIIATDEQAGRMATTTDVIDVTLKYLREALESDTHYTKVESVNRYIITCVDDVKNLARNDANSHLLIEKGVLSLLRKGLRPEYLDPEREECMKALWSLSYNTENHTDIMQDKTLLDLVVRSYNTGADPCQLAAQGVLFQLREKLSESNSSVCRPIADQFKRDTSQSAGGVHVMLSYQTKSRPMVQMVCNLLKTHGIAVWMDIYNMSEGESSTIQSMAEAVQDSLVFLMGVSEPYKNSEFCRGEAEYAFKLKKRIIPLRLQKGYNPDGWLGFIEGNKFFFDLTREKTKDQKLEELLKVVKKAFGTKTEDASDVKQLAHSEQSKTEASAHSGSAPVVKIDFTSGLSKVREWTREDVERWLDKFDFKGEKVRALTGNQIAFFIKLQSESKDRFYDMLEKFLGDDLSDMAELTFALEETLKGF